MTVLALIGGQWGEEGKGKITELLADQSRVVVRYSGGGSIRQPVATDYGVFDLQYLPRSIFNPKTISVIGAGMAFNPQILVDEIKTLRARDVKIPRFYISEQAHVIMPYHILLEELERQRYGTPLIDAPGSGLGPAYSDKINRIGFRAVELLQDAMFLARLKKILDVKNEFLTKVYGKPPLPLMKVFQEYVGYGRELREYIFDTRLILQRAVDSNYRVLLESDQGSMLDVDFGVYPFVSSSSGLPPSAISGAVGVFGAYISKTQRGPFPTEMLPEESSSLTRIRTLSKTSMNGMRNGTGALSDADRRFGWFDTVAARFVAELNGLTSIALTYLDGLDSFKTIKICTEYRLNDISLSKFTPDADTLSAVTPVYQELPGWQTSTSGIQSFADLPPACQNFLIRLQSLIGVRIDMISTGSKKEDTIVMRDPFIIAARQTAAT
jgi:adenylosuccinate synthase